MLQYDKLGATLRREREREVTRNMLVRRAQATQRRVKAEGALIDVVRLHLQGHTPRDIARRTHLSRRRVIAHVDAFDAVLILQLYRIPRDIAAAVLGRGQSLIDRCHDLIRSHLEDPGAIRDYLSSRGIELPQPASGASPETSQETPRWTAKARFGQATAGARKVPAGGSESLHESWC